MRALSIVSIWCLAVVAAFAGDPYTVGGVLVDARAGTAIEAQTEAILEGQTLAAQRLVERLTFADERAAKMSEPVSSEDATRMIRSMSVANEKRSADRYIGDITVAFVPDRVRDYLRQREMTVLDTQTRTRAVIPVEGGRVVAPDHPWAVALSNPSLGFNLTPIVLPNLERLATSTDLGALATGDVEAAAMAASAIGAQQILLAEASNGGRRVRLTDIAADSGTSQALGSVSGRSYTSSANAIIAFLESDWKSANANLGGDDSTQTRQQVTVLFDTLSDWQRLQSTLSGSARIRGSQLDALSRSGALMTLTISGGQDALASELRAKGATFSQHPQFGTVIHRAGYQFPVDEPRMAEPVAADEG